MHRLHMSTDVPRSYSNLLLGKYVLFKYWLMVTCKEAMDGPCWEKELPFHPILDAGCLPRSLAEAGLLDKAKDDKEFWSKLMIFKIGMTCTIQEFLIRWGTGC